MLNAYGVLKAHQGDVDAAVALFEEGVRQSLADCITLAKPAAQRLSAASSTTSDFTGRGTWEIYSRAEHSDASNNLGTMLWERGQLDLAQQHFEQAVRLNAANAKAADNLQMAVQVILKGEKEVELM